MKECQQRIAFCIGILNGSTCFVKEIEIIPEMVEEF
jgi:hypothetical protein